MGISTLILLPLSPIMEMNLLSAHEVELLDKEIKSANNIILVGHSRPDGDAVGACLSWANYLKEHYGKSPKVVVPNAFPDFLRWLPGSDSVIRYDKHAGEIDKLFDEAELVFCLDFNELSRTEDMTQTMERSKAKKIVIDHHIGPNIPSVLTISFPLLSSTCEIVFRIVWQMGGFETLTEMFAAPLYCGMMTDTGGFTFNSSRPEIFYIICQLLTKGIDKDKIYRNVYNNYSSWAIRLRGYLMSQKLNVYEDLHASYYTLTRQEMKDFHFIRGDAEGLVNVPLRIKGLKCSISLREDDRVDNRIWVSLRSVDDFSVEEMAKKFFNGGGHLNASGGRLDCSIDEAVAITKKAIQYFADELKRK